MKGFEKGPSPSKSSAKRNLSSSGSVENNENDLIVDELIPQFENQKISYGKNSTSGASTKKILAESNGTLSNYVDGGRKIEKGVAESAVLSEVKDDSSYKVYDPVMNCLSPRPQYLRFDPNRRREIFKRLEKEMNGSLDSEEAYDEEETEDSCLSPSVNKRNGGVREEVSDDGGEGKEEETEVKEIGEMEVVIEDNDDGYETEEEDEGETEERGWCFGGILKVILTLIGCFLSTSYMCSMNSSTHSPTQISIWDFKNSGVVIQNETLAFFGMDLQDRVFFEVDDGGGNHSTEEVEVGGESDEGFDESIEADILEYLELDENEGGEDIVDEAAEFDESIEAENVEYSELDEKERNDNDEVEDAELEYIEDVIMNMMIDAETDQDLDSDNVKNDSASEMEIIGEDETESFEEKVDDAGVEMEKSELSTSTVAVVSAVLIASASLAIIYRSKRSRRSTSAKESEPVLKQKLAVEENVLPSIDRKVEFLPRAPLPSHSEREASKLVPHIHAPIVELIAEIVVGREHGSRRNSGKFWMTVSEEERNATMSEKLSLPRPVPTQPKPSAVEPGSASFQSPTNERSISRKEGSKIREAMAEATPVRRSSRLRNRPAVISP